MRMFVLASSKSKQYIRLFGRKLSAIMSTTSRIKNFIKCCDIFGTSELLRYQKSNKFQTLTGGTLTLAIIAISILCFVGLLRSLSDSASIDTTTTVSRQSLPNASGLFEASYSKFMFGVRVAKLNGEVINLSQQRQHFTLNLREEASRGGNVTSRQGQLVRCTRQHWIGYADVLQNYDQLQVDSWLCPSSTFSYSISGNTDGSIFKTVSIDVNICNNVTSSLGCASAAEMDEFFNSNKNFGVKVYFGNPLINPASQSHLRYYLADSKQSIFGLSLGSLTQLYFSNFQIESDYGVLSPKQPAVERGMMLSQDILHNHYSPSPQMPLARISFSKSSLFYLFQRSYQQLAVVFAYFGGIASFTIIMFYLIKPYVQTYYEMSVCNQLFSAQATDKTFHIFKFIALKVYELLKALRICSRWQTGNEVITVREQIREHLSVVELIKRVLSLQNMMISLFDEFQLEDRINCSITMEEAKALRIKLKSYERPHRSEQIKTCINVEKSFPTLFEPQSKPQKEESEQYDQIVQNQKKLLENQFKIRLKAVTMLNKKIQPDFRLIQNQTIRISPMIEEPPYLAKLARDIQSKQAGIEPQRERIGSRFTGHSQKLRMRYSWKSRNSVSIASSESSYAPKQ